MLGLRWKTYQEGLPLRGANLVNYSDGYDDNNTDFSKITPALNPPLTSAGIVALYAAKHNPFVYFRSQQGTGGYANMAAAMLARSATTIQAMMAHRPA